MAHILQSLSQAHRNRQRQLAIGIAYIDELNRTYEGSYCALDDGSIRRTQAWEELFSRKEWQKAKLTHKGKCALCGAFVEPTAAICKACGAVWNEPGDQETSKPKLVFAAISLCTSIIVGYLSGELFSYIAHNIGATGQSRAWPEELINFAETYLSISSAILFLLLCTYLYEKTGLALKEAWTLASEHDRENRETTELCNLTARERSKNAKT